MTAVTRTSAMDALEARFRRRAILGEAQSVLHWDASVMMPRGGAASRGDQLAELGVLAHAILTDPALPDLLAAADEEPLDPWRRANLAEMRRIHAHATCLPEDLVAAMSQAASACETVWREAKPRNDFAAVRGPLEEVLRRVREVAAAKAEALGLSPYDALLDQYEPGARIAAIEAVFDDHASFLVDFLPAVEAAQDRLGKPVSLAGPYPLEAQRALARDLAHAVGFDFAAGRLDESAHPFSTGWPGDRRITARYDADDPLSALYAVLHECGHALYEAQLPEAGLRQPVGSARGMMLHESQSLLVEMQVGRSDAFLNWLAPRMAGALGSGPEWAPDNLARLVRQVERGFIRVDADEVTYPLHVILRTRLERALLDGSLAVPDLPGAWNDGFRALFGIAPPDDRRGCLQDIHWYDGAIGYFPTYTLGAMAAAQIFDAARTADPAIAGGIERGDLTPLAAWLATHVHGLGSSLSSDEILIRATGRALDPTVFQQHLKTRYLS